MLWIFSALAAPVVTIDVNNTLHASVLLKTTPEVLRETLKNPLWTREVGHSATSVRVVSRAESCVDVAYVTKNVLREVQYSLRRCPHPTGFRSTLLSSNTLDVYEDEWKIVPEGDQTRLDYVLRFETRLMVPQFMINQNSRSSVVELLENLDQHFQ